MLKLLGAMLVLLAGGMIGFHKAAQYANRPRQIRQLIHALQHLETEIMYGFTPLSAALDIISKQLKGPLSGLFQQVAHDLKSLQGHTTVDSWQKAIQDYWRKTAMGSNEQDIVHRLGFTLGITDREDQVKHLRLAVSQLQGEEAAAAEEQRRYEKMWKSLGVLAA
ncbi:MAG TPA: stage III sporulation protein SpoIIIAB, partial [Bacilli bacterium]